MVNANKCVIIGIEAFGMHTKVLTHGQILGACLSILGGILYGNARSQIEQEDEDSHLEVLKTLCRLRLYTYDIVPTCTFLNVNAGVIFKSWG
ncbi:unnamed protein product [Symbiodinium microadriaticum]|nr:unnamed protein product [Symbiodinium microadriaticum]